MYEEIHLACDSGPRGDSGICGGLDATLLDDGKTTGQVSS